MLQDLQRLHQVVTRFSCGVWGFALGYSLPFIINIAFGSNIDVSNLNWAAYPLMILLAWFAYRFIAPWLFFYRVDYVSQTLTVGERIKAGLMFLILATILIMLSPITIKVAQNSIVFSVIYGLSFVAIGMVYGAQLLALQPMPYTFVKSCVIGFNCMTGQNLIALIMACIYRDQFDSVDKLLKLATFQFTTFLLFTTLVGMFLLMVVYYLNNKQ